MLPSKQFTLLHLDRSWWRFAIYGIPSTPNLKSKQHLRLYDAWSVWSLRKCIGSSIRKSQYSQFKFECQNFRLETSMTLLTAKMRRLWVGALAKSSLPAQWTHPGVVWRLGTPKSRGPSVSLFKRSKKAAIPHWVLARGNVAAKQCTLLSSLSGVRNEGMGMATQNGVSKDLRNWSHLVIWGVKQCQTIHFDFSHQSLAGLLNCQFWVLKKLEP